MPEPDRSWVRSWSVAATIPMLLLGGAIVGYVIGRWLDRRFTIEPWGLFCGLVLGLTAGVREAWRLFRQAQPPTSEPSKHD